jgi:hypothetical protein
MAWEWIFHCQVHIDQANCNLPAFWIDFRAPLGFATHRFDLLLSEWNVMPHRQAPNAKEEATQRVPGEFA